MCTAARQSTGLLIRRWAVLCFFVALGISVHAHPDLLQHIDAITSEIEQQPGNGILYLRRGELHRIHEDWPAALADYDKAGTLGADNAGVELARGRLYTLSGELDKARQTLDVLARDKPGLSAVHLARAEMLQRSEDWQAAADAYTSAIATAAQPLPEWYIARAELVCMTGDDKLAAAIAGLDEGVTRLGSIVTLQLKTVELADEAGETTIAITRLQQVASQAQRKEAYLVKLAELSMRSGDTSGTISYKYQAENALATLPSRLLNTSATLKLRQRLLSLNGARAPD